MLQSEGLWSQYLEVGIGPYAEVFTKAQPLLGTLFAPNQDRGSQGQGFTHQLGDDAKSEPAQAFIINNRSDA